MPRMSTLIPWQRRPATGLNGACGPAKSAAEQDAMLPAILVKAFKWEL